MVHNLLSPKRELRGEFFINKQNLSHNQLQNSLERGEETLSPPGFGGEEMLQRRRETERVSIDLPQPPPAPPHTPSLPDKRAELSRSGHFTHRSGIGRKVLRFCLFFLSVKSLQIGRLI